MKPQSNIIRQNSLLIIFPATACSIKYISYLIKPFKLIEIPEASNVLSIVSKNLIKKTDHNFESHACAPEPTIYRV